MIRNYLKVALKVLGRRKFFTFISLFGISVTLLVLLLATALLDHVFAAQTPEIHANRMLGIYRLTMKGPENIQNPQPGYAFLDRFVRPMTKLPSVERIALVTEAQDVVSFLNGRKIQSLMRRADGDLWRVLSFDFVEGGPFTVADNENGRMVAVISETTRERVFDGRREERRSKWTASASAWRVWCGTSLSSATPPRPTSGYRSRLPSRAPTSRNGWAISRP